MSEVVVYGLSGHEASAAAVEYLEAKGVSDIEKAYIDRDPEMRGEMWARAERRNPLPQIFIGPIHVGTLSEMIELDQQGGLDPLFEAVA